MSRSTTDRTRRMMALAARPEGVSAYEADPADVGEMTKAFKRMARGGYGRWEQMAFRLVRYWLSAEEHMAWLAAKTPKPTPTPRAPKPPPAQRPALSLKPLPARITATPKPGSTAWWDKSARPHQAGYVEPRITAETRVTICAPRTPAEWLHGAA